MTNLNTLVSICKIKDLTLNLKTSHLLNFEQLKEIELNEAAEVLDIEETRIRRTTAREVVTISEVKQLRIIGPKRKLSDDHDAFFLKNLLKNN